MRKIAFIIFLFLNVSVSNALATEYGALAVAPSDAPDDVNWPTGVALHQPDPVTARNSATEQCRRSSGGIYCPSIVFESGQCVALTRGKIRHGPAESFAHFFSVSSSEKLAIEESEAKCRLASNETCSLQMTLCQPYSFLDEAHSVVSTFLDDIGVSAHLIYLPYAGAMTLLLFVFLQMRTFIRVRHHVPRDIIENAGCSAAFGFGLTASCVITALGGPKLVTFVMALSTANKLLLAAIVIGIVVFALPIRFWDALRQARASQAGTCISSTSAGTAGRNIRSATSFATLELDDRGRDFTLCTHGSNDAAASENTGLCVE
jgi:hypothetical protein